MNEPAIYHEERFRTPSPAEKVLRLWVDRTGKGKAAGGIPAFRVLGQWAAVHCIKGNGRLEIPDGGDTPVEPGHTMVIDPQTPCRYYPERTWETCWVVWNGPENADLCRLGLVPERTCVLPDPGGAAAGAVHRLEPLMRREDPAAALARKGLLLDMLYRLTGKELGSGARPSPMEQAAEYIHTHFCEEISVTGIAERFGLSPSHLRRRFREYTGRSPRELIISLRIARARELLAAGYRVGEAAAAVGYADEFYFNRLFKKYTGITPDVCARSVIK